MVTRDLSPGQSSMLRYWAMNMAAVRYKWLGFGYNSFELKRFEEIVRQVPATAYVVWLIVTASLYCLVVVASTLLFMGPLLLYATPAPPLVFLGALAAMVIFALTFGMPLAMAFGGRIVDLAFRMAPLTAVNGDAELYDKIRFQIGCLAIFGVASTGLLIWVTSPAIGVDISRYEGVVHWVYYVVLAAQGVMAFRFVRGRS
jgi:hypothetical protein